MILSMWQMLPLRNLANGGTLFDIHSFHEVKTAARPSLRFYKSRTHIYLFLKGGHISQ